MPTRSGLDFAAKDRLGGTEVMEGDGKNERELGTETDAHGAKGGATGKLSGATGSDEGVGSGTLSVQLRTKAGWKRVPEPADREAIIKEVHGKLGHFGPLRTQQLLQTGWWWAGMRKEVKEWVEKCELFCKNKATLLKSQAELQPLAIVELGYGWSLDIAGELPVTRRGRWYILLMIEHVSKWAEARPLVNKMAAAVAEAFEEMVLTRFGACGEVLTDQGTEFHGEFDELLASNRIQHRTTSRYHPQADGLTERLVQTLKKGRRVYGEAHKGDWDKKLAWVMAGYRFSKQAALKDVSAYYLLFRKQPMLPVGAPRLLTDSVAAGTAEKWVALADARAAYLKKMLPAAMESLKVAQLRDIHRYRQQRLGKMQNKEQHVEAGQDVYARRAKRDGLDLGVSQQRWTVKEVRESGVLVREDESGKRVMDHACDKRGNCRQGLEVPGIQGSHDQGEDGSNRSWDGARGSSSRRQVAGERNQEKEEEDTCER
ncbi:unnamed protein product [Closterium sp. NIES-53]